MTALPHGPGSDPGADPTQQEIDVSGVSFHDFADLDRPELHRPGMSEQVASVREEMAQEERQHAMSLAMVRKALSLTQTEVAASLGSGSPR